jgi:hypothetical protein
MMQDWALTKSDFGSSLERTICPCCPQRAVKMRSNILSVGSELAPENEFTTRRGY